MTREDLIELLSDIDDDAFDALGEIISRHAPALQGCAKAELEREIRDVWLPATLRRGLEGEADMLEVDRGSLSAIDCLKPNLAYAGELITDIEFGRCHIMQDRGKGEMRAIGESERKGFVALVRAMLAGVKTGGGQ